jgi:DNA-binding transcriptional MerR regulator
MKISEFSKRCNLSKETIRYYTEEKLILPQKIKHYYDYTEQCLKDIAIIIKLKNMAFSLSEIKDILNYLRLEPEAFPKLYVLLLDYFMEKLKTLKIEKSELEKKEFALKKEIERIKKTSTELEKKENSCSGIDLSLLSLLSCKRCHNELRLKKATIKNDEILAGILQCECGMNYKIQEGILYCEGSDFMIKAPCVSNREEFETKYPKDYNLVKKLSENWLKRKLDKDISSGDVIFDLTILGGVFSQKLLASSKSKGLIYIGCERGVGFIKVSKKVIESLENHPKSLFCCGDVKYAPFKENVFDKVIDIYGTTTDMYETGDYRIKEKYDLLKERGKFYGAYVDISNLSEENAENTRRSFDFNAIKHHLTIFGKRDLMVSPKTKEFGELNRIIKKNGSEELKVYGFSGEKVK